MFYLYILQNPQGHFYIGQTQNLQERLSRHQQGRSLYTKTRDPWTLVYSETFLSRSEATRREKYIKS